MQNLIPLKNNLRLSRFSQKFNPDLFNGLQLSNSKDNLDNSISNQTDSFITTKKSIFLDENRPSRNLRDIQDSIRENRQQDIFAKQISIKKTKFYDIEELKAYRQTMLQLPFLQQKPKKIKFKHLCPEFVEFFFQIMKSPELIQKIFSSFVSHQAIVNEFARMIEGFQLKRYHPGRTIQINKDQDYFYIFVEGVTENSTVKTASRLQRKSFCESLPSSTSLVRRSGMKTKTITSKGKVICFEGNLPILINERQFNFCSLKTACECTFLLLDKDYWNKFLIELQKLEEKQLIVFIKQWTTINLSISTINELAKKDKQVERKTFLYDSKNPKSNNQDCQSDNIFGDQIYKNQRKKTDHRNAISSTYKIFNLAKDSRIEIDNQHVYLIIKGSVYLTTKSYSIIINQGSIINTSILLNLQPQTVQIKALTDCSIVKLILSQIYFKKQDQNDFIQKIKQIQSFRNHIKKVQIQNDSQNQVNSSNLKTVSNPNQTPNNFLFNSSFNGKSSKFQPAQLRVHDLNVQKGTLKKIKKHQEPRICHHYKAIKTQPCQDQSILKVAAKFTNNYCKYQKIVESKQKVSESFKLNSVFKFFPIKDLLQNVQFKKNINLFTQNSRKSTLKKETLVEVDSNQQKQKRFQSLDSKGSFASQIQKKQHSLDKQRKEKRSSLKSLKKRRQEFQKILLDRKKKQKSKIIENLFYIDLQDNKKNQIRKINSNKNLRFSSETHPDRISEMIRRNSQSRFSQNQNQNFLMDFQIDNKKEKNSVMNIQSTTKTSRGKFDGKYLVTEPNYSQIKKMQKIISGQIHHNKSQQKNGVRNTQILADKFQNQNYISSEFLKMKKMTTRKIKTAMFNGRIRQPKVKL